MGIISNVCFIFVFCRSINGFNNSNSRTGLDHLPITGSEWNIPKHAANVQMFRYNVTAAVVTLLEHMNNFCGLDK